MPQTSQSMTVPSVTVEKNEDGFRVRTRCRECHGEVILLCGDSEPNRNALKVAGMIVCESCTLEWEVASGKAHDRMHSKTRLDASLLPSTFHGFTFEDVDLSGKRPQVVEAAKKWAHQARGIRLVLFGPVGRGKTHLAATATVERIKQWSVRWVSVPVLLAQIGAAFNTEARAEATSVLTGKDPLVLDDIDKINPSEWAKSQLFAAIDSRINEGASLIVTTNLSPSGLAMKLGEPIASRLAGTGFEVYEMDGPDRRLQ